MPKYTRLVLALSATNWFLVKALAYALGVARSNQLVHFRRDQALCRPSYAPLPAAASPTVIAASLPC